MRTLIDLADKIAIITWEEQFDFENGIAAKYNSLKHKDDSNSITFDEKDDMEKIGATTAPISVFINKIEFTHFSPNNVYEHGAFHIPGYQLTQVIVELEKLNKQCQGKTITLKEHYEKHLSDE